MKKMIFKKIAVTLTALCISACLMAPMTASAADIIIKDSTVSVVNRTFNAYKLFDMTKAAIANTDPVEYTYNYTIVDEWESAIISALSLSGTPTEEEIISAIDELGTAEAYAFANALESSIPNGVNPTATGTGIAGSPATANISLTDEGYYLIVDTSTEPSAPILITYKGEEEEVILKSDSLGIEKKIHDDKDNDTEADEGELFDANTANIGDTVKYYVTADVPDTSAYTSYTYKMTDTFDTGLTYKSDLVIKILNDDGTQELESGTHYTTSTNAQTLTINFDGLKAFLDGNGSEYVGGKIIAQYSATVNESAAVGTTGNENEIKLEYSNDPSSTATTETQPDVVVTYLGEFNIFKVDDNETDPQPLSGAGFTLYSDSSCSDDKVIYLKELSTGKYTVTDSTGTKEITTGADGKLIISGLAAGTYYIKETTAPDGYNGIDDVITMTLTATEDSKTIPDTTIDHTDGEACVWTYSSKIGAADAKDANTIQVVNNSGELLPETGGMGTRAFTVCGLALIAGAAGLYLVKRKAASK